MLLPRGRGRPDSDRSGRVPNPGRHDTALRWINQAIAFADWMPDPDRGPFHAAFNRNGKALVEAHRGRPREALALVEEAMRILDDHLEPDAHQLHRSVLRHNRAQVRIGLGDLEGALADFDHVIAADPYYTEYHFDRAGLLRRMGRPADALAEYDLALRDGLPFTEIHYNRADTLVELDQAERAVSEFRAGRSGDLVPRRGRAARAPVVRRVRPRCGTGRPRGASEPDDVRPVAPARAPARSGGAPAAG